MKLILCTFNDVSYQRLHRRFSLALSHHRKLLLHSNDSIGYRRASSIPIESSIVRIEEDAYSPEEVEEDDVPTPIPVIIEPDENECTDQERPQNKVLFVVCFRINKLLHNQSEFTFTMCVGTIIQFDSSYYC